MAKTLRKIGLSVWLIVLTLPKAFTLAQSHDLTTSEQTLRFERLSVEHGLSQSTVNCILQDSRGYMWFGTLNGLNRYDGYNFINYRHDPNDPNSISSDQVLSICEDDSANLWTGTTDGLNRFDSTHERFFAYKHHPSDENSLSHNVINAVYQDKSGALWIGTPFGLNRFVKETGQFRRYKWKPNDPMGLSHNNISAIYEDENGYLWIGTIGGGITRFDPDRKKASYTLLMNRRASLAYIPQVTNRLHELIQSKPALCAIGAAADSQDIAKEFQIKERKKVLIVSVGEGTNQMFDYGWLEKGSTIIWKMDLQQTMHAGGAPKNRVQLALLSLSSGSYTLRYRSDDSHCYDKWNHLAPDNPQLWGIRIIPVSDDEAAFFKNNLQNYIKPSAPSSNLISSITGGKDQTLWIGTHGGGLNKLEPGGTEGFLAIPDSGRTEPHKFTGEMARFVVYINMESNYRKVYNPEVFEIIDSLSQNGRQLAALSRVGDFQDLEEAFDITQSTSVLVSAMGEGGGSMDDTGFLLKDGATVWEMEFEKTRHAGGVFKNRLQIDLLTLAPGRYKLCYHSDDMHSYDGWNELPPERPELWGIEVLAVPDKEKAALKLALTKEGFANAIAGNGVRDIHIDNSGTLWIATNDGLAKFDPATGFFTNFRRDDTNPTSLSSNEVQSIYEDRSGTIWIGTILGGINKLNRNKNLFPSFTANPFVKNSLQDKIVYSFCEDRRGFIWVGTRTRLNLFDRSSGEFLNLNDTAPAIGSFPIMAILEDRRGHVWVGTQGRGLLRFNPGDDYSSSRGSARQVVDNFASGDSLFVQYSWTSDNPNGLSSNHILSLFEDSDGVLWIGTAGGGLDKLEVDHATFTHHRHRPADPSSISHNGVRTIYEGRPGILWLGTNGGGLNRFDKTSGVFEHFTNNPLDPNSLSHDTVTGIYEEDERFLWVATYGGGLNRFDKQAKSFVRYTGENGLPNNVVYSILPDDFGNLWLSTNQGLSRFNLGSKTFKNYDLDNGLQSNEFNTGAYLKCKDNSLIFGGINGFNIINPAAIKDNPNLPAIVITNFKKFDRDVKFHKSFSDLEEIKLTYQENFISFEFAALDYTNPGKNKYAYKLEGFDADWILCGNRRYASYTNLDPGDYTFRVKGSNNDGVWNDRGAKIMISISPPFWQTWWFFSLVTGVSVMALLAIHRYRVRFRIRQSINMERVRYLEREKIRDELSRDYHDELGDKLTKISLFSELIKRKLNGHSAEVLGYLDKVLTATESLSRDSKDFIWTLNPNKDKLYDLAVYLEAFGKSLFDQTDVTFQVNNLSLDLERVKLPVEWRRHLTLIFKEGMNNILKHAGCTHAVLSFSARNGTFAIDLSDNGAGFSCDNLPQNNGAGNGLINMKSRAASIDGDVTVTSELRKGTSIQFRGRVPANGEIAQP